MQRRVGQPGQQGREARIKKQLGDSRGNKTEEPTFQGAIKHLEESSGCRERSELGGTANTRADAHESQAGDQATSESEECESQYERDGGVYEEKLGYGAGAKIERRYHGGQRKIGERAERKMKLVRKGRRLHQNQNNHKRLVKKEVS